jgi:hypothetical protein
MESETQGFALGKYAVALSAPESALVEWFFAPERMRLGN